jgi:hypothetical protein
MRECLPSVGEDGAAVVGSLFFLSLSHDDDDDSAPEKGCRSRRCERCRARRRSGTAGASSAGLGSPAACAVGRVVVPVVGSRIDAGETCSPPIGVVFLTRSGRGVAELRISVPAKPKALPSGVWDGMARPVGGVRCPGFRLPSRLLAAPREEGG